MNQHTWVNDCFIRYDQLGLQPGNPDDGDWEEAHYPTPKRSGGEKTIRLLHNDHQVQGLLQSEEYGCMCFFSGHVKSFLTTGPFISEWFLLYDLYEKWLSHNGKLSIDALNSHPNTRKGRVKGGKTAGKKSGPLNVRTMHSHPNTQEGRAKGGRLTVGNMHSHPNTQEGRVKGGKKAIEVLRNHPNTKEGLVKGGQAASKATNSQRWQCLVTGHKSTSGGLSAYQKSRGIDTSLRVRVS